MRSWINFARLMYALIAAYIGWVSLYYSVFVNSLPQQVASGLIISLALVSPTFFKHSFIRFGYVVSVAIMVLLIVISAMGTAGYSVLAVGIILSVFVLIEVLYQLQNKSVIKWEGNPYRSVSGIHIYSSVSPNSESFLLRLSSLNERISRPLIISTPNSPYREVFWKNFLLVAILCSPEDEDKAVERWKQDFDSVLGKGE